MYHREARLPIDAELVPSKDKDEDGLGLDDYVDAMTKVKDEVKPKAMANISKAQNYQKQYYDRRHSTQVCVLLLSYMYMYYYA